MIEPTKLSPLPFGSSESHASHPAPQGAGCCRFESEEHFKRFEAAITVAIHELATASMAAPKGTPANLIAAIGLLAQQFSFDIAHGRVRDPLEWGTNGEPSWAESGEQAIARREIQNLIRRHGLLYRPSAVGGVFYNARHSILVPRLNDKEDLTILQAILERETTKHPEATQPTPVTG